MTAKRLAPKKGRGSKQKRPRPKHLNPPDIPAELERLFPEETIKRIARDTGFIKRERVVHPVAFFWAVVLGFGTHLQRTLSDLRRNYEYISGEDIAMSSWFDRFTPAFVDFLRGAVAHAFQQTANDAGRVLDEKLKSFADILIFDNSVVRLCDTLAKRFPATRSKVIAAGVKVSLLISAVANGPKSVSIHSERTADIKTLRIGPWVGDRIILFDLGFYKFQLFARIGDYGGFFVSRMKANGNPTFLRSLKVHRGRSIDLAGKTWQDIKDRLDRDVLDAEVEVSFSRRQYRGKRSSDSMILRLVAVWDDEHDEYHVYLTNLPQDVLSAEDVAALYRVRWEVELVFKELKSQYALDKVKTTNPNIVFGLIYTAILTLIVSRRLHNLLLRSVPREEASRYMPLLWSKVFTQFGNLLLEAMMEHIGHRKGCKDAVVLLAALYEKEARDPHVKRHRLRGGWYA